MTTKTMVSSVTVLVLLLLVNLAAVQARQVLNNSDMNGCTGGGGNVLTVWTGTGGCGPSGNQPCSVTVGSIVTGGPQPDPNNCAAYWQPGFSAYSQTLSLTPGSEAPGLYDFEAYYACIDSFGLGGTCTFSLTIGGTSILLTGAATKNAVNPDPYTPLTATGISIINPNAVVSIDCATGTADCFVTRITLIQQGSVVGDPHFVGLDGQIFDLTGDAGSAYALLSDKDVMVCVFPLSVSLFPSLFCDLFDQETHPNDPHHLSIILCRSTVFLDSSKRESIPSSLIP